MAGSHPALCLLSLTKCLTKIYYVELLIHIYFTDPKKAPTLLLLSLLVNIQVRVFLWYSFIYKYITAKLLDRMSPSSIMATKHRNTAQCLIRSYARAVRAATPPAVMRLTDMETPNTLQESKTRVSSSGVDKSAYSATEDPGSISVEELPLCWVSHWAIMRNLTDLSCGEHLGQVSQNGG